MTRRKKILISFFILFHWFCVLAWLMPKPSAIKTYLLSLSLPMLVWDSKESGLTLKKKKVVESYLYNTAMWQDWSMFAPDPLQVNRYVNATITFQDGSTKFFDLPRLSQLNFLEAWIEKRYRKLQERIISEKGPGFRSDLCRYMARKMFIDKDNPPVRVELNEFDSPIPRHDRPELKGPEKKHWVDYTKLLRVNAQHTKKVLLDYTVKAEDLL